MDEKFIAQTLGIPLDMSEGHEFEEWEYVRAKGMVTDFTEDKRGFLYRRELSPALDLDHAIKFSIF